MTHVVSLSIYFTLLCLLNDSLVLNTRKVPSVAETSCSFRCEDEESVSRCDQARPDPVESLEMSWCCRPPP